jgi:hypothetical protein
LYLVTNRLRRRRKTTMRPDDDEDEENKNKRCDYSSILISKNSHILPLVCSRVRVGEM